MGRYDNFMDKLMKVLSYVLAAAAGAALMVGLFLYSGFSFNNGGSGKLEQLKQLIQERFIGEADETAMEDGAAMGMIDALGDEWSYYISAADMNTYMEQMNNAYVGVGITVTAREEGDGINVIQVNAGGPADEAGMLVGDVIVAVNGEQIAGENLSELSMRIKGEEGTTVDLTILRGEEKIEMTVERRQIQVTVAEGEMVTDNIGLVTIYNFDERCSEEAIAAIEDLRSQGANALIFDVRNNPGGYKRELVELLDYLLPEGPLFRSEDYTGQTFVDYSEKGCLLMPMVVLVNSESYSAAEFFGAAMSEYDAAMTVGEQTYGKGYFQQTYNLVDGSAVSLSVGKYYTPKGVSLAGVGITPDVVVEVDDETFENIYLGNLKPLEDPQIQAAVALLQGE